MRWVQLSFPRADERFLFEFHSTLCHGLESVHAVLQFRIREEVDAWYRNFYCLGWPREEHTPLVHEAWLFALARAVRTYVSAKEKELVYRRIVHHDAYEKIADKMHLLHYVLNYIEAREEEGIEGVPYSKHKVEQEAIIYLESEHVLRLDGFFRFRLREYIQELCAMVDLKIEQYMAEEEQEAIIRKLRAFLFALPRRQSLLRLVHNASFAFTYYNEAWEKLMPQGLLSLPPQTESAYGNEEANIIGALAEFAPEQIVIYTRRPSHGLVMTLKKIFEEKLIVCTEFSFPVHIGPDT